MITLVKQTKDDCIEEISKKAAQLSALLTTAVGDGFKSFSQYNDTIQENFLWACADMANDIRRLVNEG